MGYKPINFDEDFGGKVAVVSGGISGIGRACVEALTHHGARVALLDWQDGSELESQLDNVTHYQCDVSVREQVETSIEKMSQDGYFPIKYLVNVAGIEYNDQGNLVEMPMNSLREIIEVNLFGFVYVVRAVVPKMEANGGGAIVNIGSNQAHRICSPGTSYQLSKAAVAALTRVLADHPSG